MAKSKVRRPASSPKSAPTVPLASVPRYPDDVLSRKNADGTVAVMKLDVEEFFFTLDSIAAEAWSLVDGKLSVERICDKLVTRHPEGGQRLPRDVAKLFSELKKERLIEV